MTATFGNIHLHAIVTISEYDRNKYDDCKTVNVHQFLKVDLTAMDIIVRDTGTKNYSPSATRNQKVL